MNQHEYTFEDFRKELTEAEQQGPDMVGRVATTGLDRWKHDSVHLAKATALFLEWIIWNDNNGKEKAKEFAGVYLSLIQKTHDDYAKKNLSWEDYQTFVHDMDGEIKRVERRDVVDE